MSHIFDYKEKVFRVIKLDTSKTKNSIPTLILESCCKVRTSVIFTNFKELWFAIQNIEKNIDLLL